jgi:NAD(P)-dependent dehydrogenase (short-subunit alcohol dehydrogenase family)
VLLLIIEFSGVLFSGKDAPENPSREKILETLNINTVGPVITTTKFLPLLRQAATVENPSKIVNMSSIAGSIEHIPEQHFWMKSEFDSCGFKII